MNPDQLGLLRFAEFSPVTVSGERRWIFGRDQRESWTLDGAVEIARRMAVFYEEAMEEDNAVPGRDELFEAALAELEAADEEDARKESRP